MATRCDRSARFPVLVMGENDGPTVASDPVLGTDFMASVKNVRELKPRCQTMGWPTSGVPAPCTGTDAGRRTRGEEDGFGGSIDRSIDLATMNSDRSRAWRDETRTDPQKFLHVQRSTVDFVEVPPRIRPLVAALLHPPDLPPPSLEYNKEQINDARRELLRLVPMEQVSCEELPSLLKCAASEKVAGFDSVERGNGNSSPRGETAAGKVRDLDLRRCVDF
ncbi:hypothetical protein GW17_00033669 [Ensete ventricosum]|nr:hypothetical protein GW17_00033669 [Ensete ventricosum]